MRTCLPQGGSASPGTLPIRCPLRHLERPGYITYVGHSTIAIALDGVTLLTDPLLRRRIGHLVRYAPPAAPVTADAVLISHAHQDHLDPPSLARLGRGTPLLVPAGVAGLLRRRRFRRHPRARPGRPGHDRLARDRGDGRRPPGHAAADADPRGGARVPRARLAHRLLRGRHRPVPRHGADRRRAHRRGADPDRRLGPEGRTPAISIPPARRRRCGCCGRGSRCRSTGGRTRPFKRPARDPVATAEAFAALVGDVARVLAPGERLEV